MLRITLIVVVLFLSAPVFAGGGKGDYNKIPEQYTQQTAPVESDDFIPPWLSENVWIAALTASGLIIPAWLKRKTLLDAGKRVVRRGNDK